MTLTGIAVLLLIYLKGYKLNGAFYKNMLSALEVSREEAIAKKSERYFVRAALSEETVLLKIDANDKREVIEKMFKALENNSHIKDLASVKNAVFERENLSPTGLADGIAIPHAKSSDVTAPQIVIATLNNAVDFGAPDEKDCDIVCMIVSPDDGVSHLDLLGRLSIMLNNKEIPLFLREASDAYDVIEELYKKEKTLS